MGNTKSTPSEQYIFSPSEVYVILYENGISNCTVINRSVNASTVVSSNTEVPAICSIVFKGTEFVFDKAIKEFAEPGSIKPNIREVFNLAQEFSESFEDKTQQEWFQVIDQLAEEFNPSNYHWCTHNSLHFVQRASEFLNVDIRARDDFRKMLEDMFGVQHKFIQGFYNVAGTALYATGVVLGNANPATRIAPGLIQASRIISPDNPLHQLQ